MDPSDLWEPNLAVVMAVAFTMSAIHSIVGFAFALLATPFLIFFYPPQQVVALTILLMIVLNGLIIATDRQSIDFSTIRNLIIPVLIGLPYGLAILFFVSTEIFTFLVGVATAGFAATLLLQAPWLRRQVAGSPALAGFLGGVLTTSINFNAPPVVIYLAALRLPGHVLRATTAAYLIGAHLAAVALFYVTGLLTTDVVKLALMLTPGCICGFWLGSRIVRHSPSPRLFTYIMIAILVMGVVTAATPILLSWPQLIYGGFG